MSDDENHYIYDDHIDYDHLITGSMHWLIRTTLAEVASKGFPGEHHLYISFDTTDPSVQIPDSLKQRYPEEMTIVLQNRFYDLIVTDNDFSVSLSFSRVLERLIIPYAALTRFYDPSCGFVLQLSNWEENTSQSDMADETDAQDQHIFMTSQPNETDEDSDEDEASVKDAADKVVSLDQFRKK